MHCKLAAALEEHYKIYRMDACKILNKLVIHCQLFERKKPYMVKGTCAFSPSRI